MKKYNVHTISCPTTRQKVRFMFINRKPWFFAFDVAKVLGAFDIEEFVDTCHEIKVHGTLLTYGDEDESSMKILPSNSYYKNRELVLISADEFNILAYYALVWDFCSDATAEWVAYDLLDKAKHIKTK